MVQGTRRDEKQRAASLFSSHVDIVDARISEKDQKLSFIPCPVLSSSSVLDIDIRKSVLHYLLLPLVISVLSRT